MDPTRLVIVSLMVFGIVFALFLDKVLDLVWASASLKNTEVLEGLGWRVTTVLGVCLATAGGVFVWVNQKTRSLSLEIATELMKVTWPTWEETRISTIAVVVASVVAAVILFGIDSLSYKVMVEWLPALWGKLN
ncbi:MAG: preprotein translocase subunit SecE [Myxococcaceae bacterium]|nr:preprotein translocase subunit SecE [Myxococcaceae bacterium]